MKAVCPVIVLASLVLALCIWDLIYINNAFEFMENESEQIYVYVMQSDVEFDELELQLDELNDYWQKTEDVLCLIINRNEMRDIGHQLQFLRASATLNDIDECIMYARQFYFSVKTLAENTKLRVQNIL